MLQHCIPNFLEQADTPSLANKRINNRMMSIFKCINFTNYPAYLKGLFQFGTSDHTCSLRCMNVLVLPNPKQLHMVLTQLDMPRRDFESCFLILLGEPLVGMNLDIYFFPIAS